MALEGSLQDMSLVDLIQVFRMGPKTGILLLVGGSERGIIYVAEGRMIDAAVVRGPERQMIATGEEAVLHLLQWEDATFTFRADPAVTRRPPRIVQDHEWLILEGLRRRSTPIQTQPYQRLTLDSRVELAALSTSAESGIHLDLDQWRLLSQVSASRNMREVSEKTGIAPERTLRIASELIAIGLLDVTIESSPPPTQRATLPSIPKQARPAVNGSVAHEASGSHGHHQADGRGLLNAIMRRIRGL
jgi:hypothetical protein